MMKFCTKCGKQLEDGEECSCTATVTLSEQTNSPAQTPPLQTAVPPRAYSSIQGSPPVVHSESSPIRSSQEYTHNPVQAYTTPPTYIQPPAQVYTPQSMQPNNMEYVPEQINAAEKSFFDGGLLQLIGWRIAGFFVILLTLGICTPWAICMIYRWETKHTVIQGKRLVFIGSAIGLFGQWIKWLLLSIITIGIYSLWVGIALRKWKTKNTIFQ